MSEWIPYKDGDDIPPDHYLVTIDDGRVTFVATCDRVGAFGNSPQAWILADSDYRVTAYRPLPEPYRGEE